MEKKNRTVDWIEGKRQREAALVAADLLEKEGAIQAANALRMATRDRSIREELEDLFNMEMSVGKALMSRATWEDLLEMSKPQGE